MKYYLTTIKKVVFFYLIILFGCLVMFFFLKQRYQRLYSPEKLNDLLVTQSKFRDTTQDPCQYHINGDPLGIDDRYIKIKLYCRPGEESFNTLSLDVFKNKPTYTEAIQELSRVNGFPAVFKENNIDSLGTLKNTKDIIWSCYIDQNLSDDLDTIVRNASTIDCFYGVKRFNLEIYGYNGYK